MKCIHGELILKIICDKIFLKTHVNSSGESINHMLNNVFQILILTITFWPVFLTATCSHITIIHPPITSSGGKWLWAILPSHWPSGCLPCPAGIAGGNQQIIARWRGFPRESECLQDTSQPGKPTACWIYFTTGKWLFLYLTHFFIIIIFCLNYYKPKFSLTRS